MEELISSSLETAADYTRNFRMGELTPRSVLAQLKRWIGSSTTWGHARRIRDSVQIRG